MQPYLWPAVLLERLLVAVVPQLLLPAAVVVAAPGRVVAVELRSITSN